MSEPQQRFEVLELPELKWPTSLLRLPCPRFRLFVAADVEDVTVETMSEFALTALQRGMVYLCAWGPGCELLHDITDEVRLEDDLGEGKFCGPTRKDIVMTAWHAHETLDEALDFFVTHAVPTEGFVPGSDFWLVVCVRNSDWAETARRTLQTAKFLA
jgi:hypothetical protein